jgi:hypothetical protein
MRDEGDGLRGGDGAPELRRNSAELRLRNSAEALSAWEEGDDE